MFIRTSSTLVSQAKSTLFRCNLQNSFLRGGARASICNASFSSMINFTAGYTFVPSIAEQVNFRGAINADLDHAAKTMLIGIGLDVAKFKFDGSGDSGDIELEEIVFTIDDSAGDRVYDNIGVIDSYKQEHDVVMRDRAWSGRGWSVAGTNTVSGLLEHLAYSSLEEQYGGWEINAGSSGYVTVTGDGVGIEIDYEAGTYYCDHCDSEYDDDTSCECVKCPDCYEPTEDGVCDQCETKLIKCKGIDGEKCKYFNDATEDNPVCHCCQAVHDRQEEQKAKEAAQ